MVLWKENVPAQYFLVGFVKENVPAQYFLVGFVKEKVPAQYFFIGYQTKSKNTMNAAKTQKSLMAGTGWVDPWSGATWN